MNATDVEALKSYVNPIADFPKTGVMYYDINRLLQSPKGLNLVLNCIQSRLDGLSVDKIVGVDARGFIFGGVLADRLNAGMVLARKPGKLPPPTINQSYDLEYGTDALEMRQDAIVKGERVAIVDDVIATGGTLEATCHLCEQLGAEIMSIQALIALPALGFQKRLSNYPVEYLLEY